MRTGPAPQRAAITKKEVVKSEMHGKDVEQMKRAFSQYHIQMRKDYSQRRLELIEQEDAKRREAWSLVKALKSDKEGRAVN